MGKGNTHNKHGVPLRGGDPPRPQICIWPACMDPVGNYRSTRMCDDHAQYVAQEFEAAQRVPRTLSELLNDARPAQPESLPTPEPEPEPREEIIYYVQYAEHIKIGWTTNLERRLKRGFKPGGRLLAVHPGTRSDEAKLHKRFAAYRTHGNEWYAPMPSLLHHIELLKKEHGEPPDITVGPDPVGIPEPREKQYIGGPNHGYQSFHRRR